MGEIDIGKKYIESAIKSNANFLPAEKNLQNIKWHQVPRWHFRMLNDKRRNLAYFEAIKRALNEGCKNVVDIGSGCGLLSLMAACNDQSAVKVAAIEENKTLFQMCSKIVKNNQLENIAVLNYHSTNLKIKKPFDLVVTEIFDVALFGEKALDTLIHANTELVSDTEGVHKIIPASAQVYVAGIQSEEIVSKFRYISTLKELNLENICIKQKNPEPYEAENLEEKLVDYITNIAKIFHVDFSNVEQLDAMLNDETFGKIVELRCIEKGTVHALAVWFDLNLWDDIKITTSPLNTNHVTCWEQAIFYLDHPLYLQEDEKIFVKVTLVESQLKLSIINDRFKCPYCYKVSKGVIAFLNDDKLVKTIVELSEKLCSETIMVVDYNIFPLLGLLMAKKGCKVFHIFTEEFDLIFLYSVLKLNNITTENFGIMSKKMSEEYFSTLRKSSVVYVDPINTDGSLNALPFENCGDIKKAIYPRKTIINIILINSSYIDYCNKVDDENTMNFKIGEVMNEFTGTEHPDLEKLAFTQLSDRGLMEIISDNFVNSVIIPVRQSGVVNALYYWFDLHYGTDLAFSTLESTYYKKSCAILQDPKNVKVGDKATIVLKVEDSHLKFTYE